jgi:hypothetical protein
MKLIIFLSAFLFLNCSFSASAQELTHEVMIEAAINHNSVFKKPTLTDEVVQPHPKCFPTGCNGAIAKAFPVVKASFSVLYQIKLPVNIFFLSGISYSDYGSLIKRSEAGAIKDTIYSGDPFLTYRSNEMIYSIPVLAGYYYHNLFAAAGVKIQITANGSWEQTFLSGTVNNYRYKLRIDDLMIPTCRLGYQFVLQNISLKTFLGADFRDPDFDTDENYFQAGIDVAYRF